MAGPTPERVAHYVRMFEQLRNAPAAFEESMRWTVVRPHQGRFAVDEVLRRLRGDPGSVTTCRPADWFSRPQLSAKVNRR
jgi:hypothetical protein